MCLCPREEVNALVGLDELQVNCGSHTTIVGGRQLK